MAAASSSGTASICPAPVHESFDTSQTNSSNALSTESSMSFGFEPTDLSKAVPSGYIAFRQSDEAPKPIDRFNVAEYNRLCGERWRAMTDIEREAWNGRAREAKEQMKASVVPEEQRKRCVRNCDALTSAKRLYVGR